MPSPVIPLPFPAANHEKEAKPLWWTDLTNRALLAPDFKAIFEYERSVKEFPNIEVGKDFQGYKKPSVLQSQKVG